MAPTGAGQCFRYERRAVVTSHLHWISTAMRRTQAQVNATSTHRTLRYASWRTALRCDFVCPDWSNNWTN